MLLFNVSAILSLFVIEVCMMTLQTLRVASEHGMIHFKQNEAKSVYDLSHWFLCTDYVDNFSLTIRAEAYTAILWSLNMVISPNYMSLKLMKQTLPVLCICIGHFVAPMNCLCLFH